jgi:hypothetical protein
MGITYHPTAPVVKSTKRALVIELMLRPEGTTQAECLAITGWRAINLVRMAKEYGLSLRTETARINNKSVTRYFASPKPTIRHASIAHMIQCLNQRNAIGFAVQ